jgi:flavin reductase (DIM6/NTAB) family NADH-FMN oxidoreductase RutF
MNSQDASSLRLDDNAKKAIAAALGRIPSGLFILTARHEDRRLGMLVSWVQQVCFEPPMVSVVVAKGRPIMPLISESRKFGLCQLQDKERLILRKFAGGADVGEDPFLGFEMVHSATGVPILANVLSYLECEVVCHMDVEGDHDIFVGAIKAGKTNGGPPHVHLRDDGLKY